MQAAGGRMGVSVSVDLQSHKEFMRCFYHHDRESVGGCKSCGKGLCPECAVDMGKGLACRGRCEEDVRQLVTLIDRNIKLTAQTGNILDSSRRIRSSGASFNLVFGSIFLAWGLTDPEAFRFMILLGVCFIAYGVFGMIQARKPRGDRKDS